MTDQVLSAREELYEIAELLHDADVREKGAKAEKEAVRGPFFDLISEIIREEVPLARKTVTVELPPIEEVRYFDQEEWRKFHYPEWSIVAIQPESDDEGGPATRHKITLEENDQFKKFEFVHGGFRFGRTIRMEGKDFKAADFWKDMKKADKTLDAKLKKALQTVVAEKIVTVYEVDEAKAMQLMADHPETVAIFQKYMFPGTPKPALLPIKEVKE